MFMKRESRVKERYGIDRLGVVAVAQVSSQGGGGGHFISWWGSLQ